MRKLTIALALSILSLPAAAQTCETVHEGLGPGAYRTRCSDGAEYYTYRDFGTTRTYTVRPPQSAPVSPYPAGGYPECSSTSGTPCRLKSGGPT
jgi:hypothetical protein